MKQLPFAFVIGLSCSEFYSLTIKQWVAVQKGWKIRRDAEIHEKAVLTINLMSSSGNIKKGTSFKSLYDSIVKQLKGEESEKEQIKKAMSEDDINYFKHRFGVK